LKLETRDSKRAFIPLGLTAKNGEYILELDLFSTSAGDELRHEKVEKQKN